ncbi:MAG: creatininase family protein [Firmicutes bacterium]|nr:creatininase family protein [Bacillota bacterium]
MYWEHLTSKTFQEQVINRVDTAILPTGSVEAHGMHCPLGTDNIAPAEFAARLEALYPERVLVLPAVPYGHTWDLAQWPGTISVSNRAFSQYVAEVGTNASRWGIRNLILMNGHGGNVGALQEAMESMAEAGMRAVLVNWWLDYSQDILTVTSGQGHAGEDETAVMLAMAGNWVKMEDATFNPYKPKFRVKAIGIQDKVLRHATTGDGRLGTKEKGEKIIELVVARLSHMLEDLWQDDLFTETH